MGTLRELTDDMLELMAELEENGGEFTPEIEERYAATKDKIGGKVDSYATIIAETKGEIDTLDTEIKRLQAKKKAKSNMIDRMKSNLLFNLQLLDMEEVKTDLYKASVKFSKSVGFNQEAVDEMVAADIAEFAESHPYLRVKVEVDKTGIMNAHKAGEDVPEWSDIEMNASVTIR